jgi:carbamoylphosphate synthase large subunit
LGESGVQTFDTISRITPHVASPDDIASFERLLLPLGYDGPATVDYRRRPDGRLAVFEINPRFGGSLMRPAHEDDLVMSLRTVLDNATPPRRWR